MTTATNEGLEQILRDCQTLAGSEFSAMASIALPKVVNELLKARAALKKIIGEDANIS